MSIPDYPSIVASLPVSYVFVHPKIQTFVNLLFGVAKSLGLDQTESALFVKAQTVV